MQYACYTVMKIDIIDLHYNLSHFIIFFGSLLHQIAYFWLSLNLWIKVFSSSSKLYIILFYLNHKSLIFQIWNKLFQQNIISYIRFYMVKLKNKPLTVKITPWHLTSPALVVLLKYHNSCRNIFKQRNYFYFCFKMFFWIRQVNNHLTIYLAMQNI